MTAGLYATLHTPFTNAVSQNGPYPPSLITFTCTWLLIMHTCSSSSQPITPALLKHTPHSSHVPISFIHVDTTRTLTLQRTASWVYLSVLLTLCLPSHHQLPVHLWTLETRRLSRIPIRHEPAKGQRHSQNPSALSTILPRKATHLTQRLSPLLSHQILVNKLTVLNTNLCVRQFRNRRSDPKPKT